VTAPAINATIGLSGSDFRFTPLPESTRGFIRTVKHPGLRLRGGSEEPMRILWTTVKLVIALVIVVPISLIVLALTLGLFGALVGLLSSMFRRGLTTVAFSCERT
jgi:hypothetical protein